MGLITSLIERHDRQKQDDWSKKMSVMTQLASMDNLKPEAKEAVFSNIASLAGDRLDLPKKHHGMFAQLLMGMHGHLSKGGQGDGGESGEGGQGQSQGGLDLNALKVGPAAESKVSDGAGKLPSVPKYSPFYSDEQVHANRRTAGIQDEQAKYAETARQEQQTTTREDEHAAQIVKLQQARLDKMLENNIIDKEQHGRASAEIQAGIKLPGITASMLPKLGWAEVKDGKGGTRRVPGRVDPSGAFTTLTGQEIDPETITKIGTGKDTGEDVRGQIGQLTKAETILKDPNATPEEKAAARLFIDHATLQNQSTRVGIIGKNLSNQDKSITLDADRTNAGVLSSGSGGGGGGGVSVGVSTGTGSSSAATSSAGSGSRSVGVTTSTKPSQAETKTITGGSTPKIKLASAMSNERTMSDIDFAKDVILGNMPGGGRDKISKARMARGLAALHDLTGLSPEKLSASLKQRKGVADALVDNSKRYAAYTRLDKELGNMGVLLKQARERVPNYNAFLNKLANHVNRDFRGDKETAALVIAVNGYSRVYTTLVGGAWVSNAMPHVTSSEQANHAIADFMTNGQIDGVLDQVHRESLAVRKGLVDTNADLAGQLGSDLGSEAKSMSGDQGTAKEGSSTTLPKPEKPFQVISGAQIAQYIAAAGGDPVKAKEMARKDKWGMPGAAK